MTSTLLTAYTISASLALVFALLTLQLFYSCLTWNLILTVIQLGFYASLSYIAFDITMSDPASNLSWKALFSRYFLYKIVYLWGRKVKSEFDKDSKSVTKVQEETLLKFLKANKNSAYGKDFHLDEISNISTFRSKHPLTNYEHYRSYHEREIDGESNVVTPGTPVYFAFTTGTTGANKKVKITKATKSNGMGYFMLFVSEIYKVFPNFQKLHYDCEIKIPCLTKKSPKGVEMGPLSGMYQTIFPFYTTPAIAFKMDCSGREKDMMYIHCLFALREKKISFIYGSFVAIYISFFEVMERRWRDLCHDIHWGTLTQDLDIPSNIRVELTEKLTLMPERGEQLRIEFSKGFDGIVRRIWPEMEFVICLTSGPFELAAKPLHDKYLKEVRIISPLHASTEAFMGINIDILSQIPTYACTIRATFYEFIPIEQVDEKEPPTLLINELQVGQKYEIVITNDRGFYRYRMGDVIKVVDHYNQVPVYTFEYRIGQMLNLYWEKTPETIFQSAILKAIKKITSIPLNDWAATENNYWEKAVAFHESKQGSRATPPLMSAQRYYVLFLAFTQPVHITEDQKWIFDAELKQEHELYSKLRDDGSIQSMEVVEFENGIFDKLKQFSLSENPSSTTQQYKYPKAIRKMEHLQFLTSQLNTDILE